MLWSCPSCSSTLAQWVLGMRGWPMGTGGCCSSPPRRVRVCLSCWPAVLGTWGQWCRPGKCVTGGHGDGHRGCFWVAAACLNICHVLALIIVIGCWRAVLAPALAPRGSVSTWRSLCHLSLALKRVPVCLRGHGPCHLHTHTRGARLSPTPRNLVVTAASWEVKTTFSLGQRPGMLQIPVD